MLRPEIRTGDEIMDNKETDKKLSTLCYIPYFGPIYSIYNLVTDKETDFYCKFHNYHALFYGVLIFILWITLTFMSFCGKGIPLIGSLLVWVLVSCQALINIVYIISSLFWAYMTFQGKSFRIPLITEYTNKYMERRDMLPGK